ncbi:hypothetical protein CTM74_00115 [Fusobacterium pseudoperiodonticum]|uniref:Uncharacterized protein n=1 Tax=Fusobacterium pseudoperiodonticum TaxID=2663009 RepID=A0AAD0AJB9_9FUSO|nr:hypothetical protein CTM64_12220 [Fusobacterium pseudoperiodonticum]ATV60434.1 hypothetical protein CTM74_00115 [Fusobacterium pseudoperiodonticum]
MGSLRDFLRLLVKGLKEDELRKEYGYGNYQDKGLTKTKEINMSPQSYKRKEIPTTADINEYLNNLREGVGL